MSHHLFISFVILAVFCTMSLSEQIQKQGENMSSQTEIDVNKEHHDVERKVQQGHDLEVHPQHGHVKHHCRKNEVWSQCGANCQATCKIAKIGICPEACVSGCVCEKGLVRNKHHKCVHICDC